MKTKLMNGSRNNDKHKRILDAAVKVFARNGFFNSKVAEIAKEANVADGTIYLYFKNKDDILISLFEYRMNQVISLLNDRMKGVDDPIEKVRIFINAHFELLEQHPNLAAVITLELRQSTKFMKEYDNQKFMDYLGILSDIIKDGTTKGIFRNDLSPGIIKRAFFGMMDELGLYYVLSSPNSQYSCRMMADQMTNFVLSALLKLNG